MSRAALAVAAAAAVLAATAAHAEPPRGFPDEQPADADEAAERHSDFWERALRPAGDTYDDAVARARARIETRETTGHGEAEELLRGAIELAPDRLLARWWLGELYFRQGRWAPCAEQLGVVFEHDPTFEPPEARVRPSLDGRLADCLAGAGDYEGAIEHYERMLARPKHPADAYWQVGLCYMALGRLADAIAAFEIAIRENPARYFPYFAIAVAYDRDERTERAAAYLDGALRMDRSVTALDDPAVLYVPASDELYFRGLVAEARGMRAWALTYFRSYAVIATESPWLHRANAHIVALGAAADDGDLAVRGSAALDRRKAEAAVARAQDDLQECVRATPRALFRVRITSIVGPARRPAPSDPIDGPRGGIQVTVEHNGFHAPAEVASAGDCLDAAARRIKLPKPSGRPNTYATVELHVIAR